ncbi:MAG: hypothetical protein K1X79_02730 [Oligoflexia bacterium]|nr:hypothetical protein [Oligoflexia bacterium]
MATKSELIHVTAFYKFGKLPLAALNMLRDRIIERVEGSSVRGLILLAPEGCNGTIAGLPEDIEAFKPDLESLVGLGPIIFKDSEAERQPFRRFKIDLRKEIVTLGVPDRLAEGVTGQYLTAAQWHAALKGDEKVYVLDTRNTYEVEIGRFKNAIDPCIGKFSEFPDYVARSGIPKDAKVLMYCTGGIRCEKASVEMERQGYSNVYQLQGGILKYLEDFPEQCFDGECFVFDHRVAVDQHLQPSRQYKLCPHCGNPAKQQISCAKCGTGALVCDHCLTAGKFRNTCSKNCAAHLERVAMRAASARAAQAIVP